MIYRTGIQATVYRDRQRRQTLNLTITALAHKLCYGVDNRGQCYAFAPAELVAYPTALALDHRTYGGRVVRPQA